ncbi:MAG: 7TM diverse intracellular signaling domain-containing protein [Spirosomataceae bacterium]
MIRNLVGLLLLVILVIWGMSWYHIDSTKALKGQPLLLTHWEDTTAKAALPEVMKVGDFKPIGRQRYNFGYTESLHWFKFRVKTQGIPAELSLEIKNHLINRLELFEVHDGKITSLGKSGDEFVFSQRPTPSRFYVYPISLEANDQADYYLCLDKRFENLATEITLWQTGDFEDKDQREYLLWGIFSGVVLFIIILNLIFWNTTQDSVYLWYSAYIAGLTLRQLADSGLGFQYVWPNLPALNYPDAIIQALWLYVPAQLQFQQQFLELRKSHPLQYKISQVLKYSFLVCLIVLIVLQISGIVYRFSGAPILISRIHAVISSSTMFFFLWIVAKQLRSDDSLKRMYGAGLGLQMIGQIIIIIQNLLRNRVNGLYFIDSYLILFFIFFIDVVLFAYLLAYRYRKTRADHQQLQLNLALTQQATNRKIIEVLESERHQVNDLLLNDVGRRLNASTAALTDTPQSPILTDALRLISIANEDLSRIVENRIPVEFIEKGLVQTLSELTEQLNQSQKTVFQFRQIGELVPLPINDEIQLYRICTELINNLIKHAQATQAEIRLEQQPNCLVLCVEDNGKGIDSAKIKAGGGGIGFKNIYARAQELGAEVSIDSSDEGTCISLKIQTS